MPAADPTLLPALSRALASEGEQGEHAGIDERILDAARDLIAAYGPRRTSIDDIAARAGVARATVFRRFRSKDAVIDRLVTREAQRFLLATREAILAAPDPESSVVEAFVAVVRYAASHPLLDRLARVEPQVLIESLRTGDPSPFELGSAFVADRLRSGQRRGAIPDADADELADVLVRLTVSYLLIPSRVLDLGDEEQIRRFAHTMIAPLVTGRQTGPAEPGSARPGRP
jgi:AcrR family transcriptional regulator